MKEHLSIAQEALRTMALTTNYNAWLIDIMRPFIGDEILEIGCGIGNLTMYLKREGQLSCLDNSEYFIAHMKVDYPELTFYQMDISLEISPPLAQHRFDTIICVNVLEHIEDDEQALLNMKKLLKPGGRILLFIPALEWLYGTLDIEVEHFRRYNKNRLSMSLEKIGMEIASLRYYNLLGVGGWFINGRIMRRRSFPVLQPLLYDKIVPIIAYIERHWSPPYGMSLFAVASKREE